MVQGSDRDRRVSFVPLLPLVGADLGAHMTNASVLRGSADSIQDSALYVFDSICDGTQFSLFYSMARQSSL